VEVTPDDMHRGLPYRVGVGLRVRSKVDLPRLNPEQERLLGAGTLLRRRLSFTLGRTDRSRLRLWEGKPQLHSGDTFVDVVQPIQYRL
jgi:hypothetical protein